MIRRAMLWLNQTVRLIPARKLIGLSGPYIVLVCFVRYLRTGEDIPLNLSTVLQWYTATTAPLYFASSSYEAGKEMLFKCLEKRDG